MSLDTIDLIPHDRDGQMREIVLVSVRQRRDPSVRVLVTV